ncbi:helix-turn-helix transcriptional regulator [Peribacillus sp. NPDC097675]|uniref:helix-turn-helix transcriptional regulator n=1 Tax=Peribacillus sp. NPDC097675 TaxID=3390618 RepID=UPI003CFED849
MKKNHALIYARKEKQLTQFKLAVMMGCKKTTISNWENGYAKPKLIDAFKLSIILEKKIEDIFFDSDVQVSHTLEKLS